MAGKIKKIIRDRKTIKDVYNVVKLARRKEFKPALEILSKNEKVREIVLKHQNVIFFFLRKYKDEILLVRRLYELNRVLKDCYDDEEE